MNKGIKKACGDYCLFLNSGDWLLSEDTVQNEKNASHTEDIVYFNSINVKGNHRQKAELPDKLDTYYFASGHTIFHQNELIKTNLLKETPYNENLKLFSDNEFNIKTLILQKKSYKHCSNTISCYEAASGMSSTQRGLLFKEQKQVLIECFGEEIYNRYQLLNDYETGYYGIMKKIRSFLNWMASKTTRKYQVENKH